jgi:hypothetical protein
VGYGQNSADTPAFALFAPSAACTGPVASKATIKLFFATMDFAVGGAERR